MDVTSQMIIYDIWYDLIAGYHGHCREYGGFHSSFMLLYPLLAVLHVVLTDIIGTII